MNNEQLSEPPFIDDGKGFPTPDSARQAFNMFSLDRIADIQGSYMGQRSSMVELVTRCRIERLVENWPKAFIAQVMGAASQAGQEQG